MSYHQEGLTSTSSWRAASSYSNHGTEDGYGNNGHQPIDEWLRESVGLQAGQPVNLSSLPDPPPGMRPVVSFKVLVALAIYGSPFGCLSLIDIYTAIEERFPYYRNIPEEIGRDGRKGGKRWQRNIRHSLSLESIFVNKNRPINEPGKGGYWHVTNANGYGQKRERKRRGQSTTNVNVSTWLSSVQNDMGMDMAGSSSD